MLSRTDFENALGPETVRGLTASPGASEPDDAVLAHAQDHAIAEVRRITAFDDDDPPREWRDLVLALAAERLFARRRETIPAEWVARATEARRQLARLRPRFSPAPTRDASDRTTNPGKLAGY